MTKSSCSLESSWQPLGITTKAQGHEVSRRFVPNTLPIWAKIGYILKKSRERCKFTKIDYRKREIGKIFKIWFCLSNDLVSVRNLAPGLMKKSDLSEPISDLQWRRAVFFDRYPSVLPIPELWDSLHLPWLYQRH